MAAALDAYDLSQVSLGGIINEDVMQTIFDISQIPLPFTSRVGSGSHSNAHFEWTLDRLQAPDTSNAVIDGSEGRSNQDVTPTYGRVGNDSQISTKTIHTSVRAQESDTIGFRNRLAYGLVMRGNELRRDVEAMALLNNANVVDTGAGGVAGETAGLEAWVADEDELGDTIYDATGGNPSQYRDMSTGGIGIGGWPNQSGGIIPAVNYSGVTAAGALSEEAVRDVVEALYLRGFGTEKGYTLMARPSVIRRLSEFFFSSSARVGTLVQEMPDSTDPRTANGAVNLFRTDFGVLEFVPNRLMQQSGDGSPSTDTVFIFDPSMVEISYLHGYRTYPLAKTGLLDKREIAVDWGLRVKNWTAVGAIFGVDASAAVTLT